MATRKKTTNTTDSNLQEAKKAVLDRALHDIVKKYGEGSIMRLGEATHMEVASIPTGSLSLDMALGIGGIPKARITEIYGPESSGKTTFASTSSPNARHKAELQHLLTWNTLSTPLMQLVAV